MKWINPVVFLSSISSMQAFSVTDYEGDGTVDYTGSTFEDISYTYTTEGIYYPTITVTDTQSITYTDTIAVVVLNEADLDALLRAKWEAMKTALAAQDISSATNYLLGSSKNRYQIAFNVIIDDLPQMISQMQDIEMIYLMDNVAKYRINRVHDINGTLQTITYYIYFVCDEDGLWKIDRF